MIEVESYRDAHFAGVRALWLEAFPDDPTIEDLRHRGVDYVIVHGAFYAPEEYRRLARRLEERRDIHLEAVTQWEQEETRLYRLVK